MKRFFNPRTDKEIEYEHIIYGNCHGVLFYRRGKDDPHVCMYIITEDDENWFISESGVHCSTYWLSDLTDILIAAELWLENSPEVKKSGYSWEFVNPNTSYEVGGDGELVPH